MEDDKTFWTENFREHLIFLMEHLHNNKKLFYEAKYLYNNYYNFSIFLITHLLSKFNDKIYKLASEGKIDVPLGLIKHQIEEYEFFMMKMSGKMTYIDEIIFWNNNDMEHLQLNLKYLDKTDVKTIALCNSLISEFKKLEERDIDKYFFKRSLEVAISTDRFHRRIKNSSISNELLNHIIKEGKRGILARMEFFEI